MGRSLDAYVCFGIPLKIDAELPWGKSIEDWWVNEICQFKPTKQCYSESGDRIEGTSEEDIGLFFAELKAITKTLPVRVMYSGYAEYPSVVLAMPKYIQMTIDGEPQKLLPTSIDYENHDMHASFAEFLSKYVPNEIRDGELDWYFFPTYG